MNRNALVVALTIAMTLTAPLAAGGPVSVHPPGDVFDAPPPPASIRGKRSCQVAQKYIDLTAAGRYDQLSTLFADNATFLTPAGKVLNGAAAIGDFYKNFLPTLKPRNVPISFMADGDECVMELVTATNMDNYAKYRLAAIDHFTVDKRGKIRHMVVYLRPQSLQALPQAKPQ